MQDAQLTGVRAENNELRNGMAAERKRLADMEASLRARASAGRSSGNPSGGYMSNKKASVRHSQLHMYAVVCSEREMHQSQVREPACHCCMVSSKAVNA